MRSILRWLTDRPASPGDTPRSIVLLFANRFEDSVPFREELEQLEARLPGLRVVHVISQPKEDWRGYRGHIDRVVLGHELPQQPSWTYYVSGPPTFGHSMQEQLIASGVAPGSIKVESFDGYE